MSVLSLLLQIKIASFIHFITDGNSMGIVPIWLAIRIYPGNKTTRWCSLLHPSPYVRFIFIIEDQNCQFYQIIITEQNCQLFVYCCRWKRSDLFSLLLIKIASFILFVAYQNCQFYLYCHRWKMPVLSKLLQIKNVIFIFIAADQNCQFYLHCHRSKLPVLSVLSQIKMQLYLKWQRS